MLWTRMALRQWVARRGDIVMSVEKVLSVRGADVYRWRVHEGGWLLDRGTVTSLKAAQRAAERSARELEQELEVEPEPLEELGVGMHDWA